MKARRKYTTAIGLVALFAVATPPALAEDLEAWVSRRYYEGLPLERASDFGAQEIARLAALLDDPGESAHHANIVLALGASGHPHAFAVLAAHAADVPSGEVDRDTFRVRAWLPIAMGHLAREDRRALIWLLQEPRSSPGSPGWSFRQQRGDHLAELLAEARLTGLALSGSPQARRILDRLASQPSAEGDRSNERRRRHVLRALEVHARIAEGGPPVLHPGDEGPGGAR